MVTNGESEEKRSKIGEEDKRYILLLLSYKDILYNTGTIANIL